MAAFDAKTKGPNKIADLFENPESSGLAWHSFQCLSSWPEREEVVQLLHSRGGSSLALYKEHYRSAMNGIILDEFYCHPITQWAEEYAVKGEVSVPFLDPGALPMLAAYAESVEAQGKKRYDTTRPCYPPGEVALKFATDDPRSQLVTGVNMTSVGSGHMTTIAKSSGKPTVDASPVQWIYHSPHLREFVRILMGSESLHPYMSDLGVAVNIMKPSTTESNGNVSNTNANMRRTALGFHFDSINSSGKRRKAESMVDTNSNLTQQDTNHQLGGATGVIGIQDCREGGERVVFPSIDRSRVDAVQAVVDHFDPLRPSSAIGKETPNVFTGTTAGDIYLFNGGDTLHGVSAVRKGTRIAAVFLFQEDKAPESTVDGYESCKYFYDNSHKNAADEE